ncbi:MAG: matrixin family metalloprotease [Acidobacteria bacterium]|nr:matrixin family metalloprotease [Acidobacteriota bacterium]
MRVFFVRPCLTILIYIATGISALATPATIGHYARENSELEQNSSTASRGTGNTRSSSGDRLSSHPATLLEHVTTRDPLSGSTCQLPLLTTKFFTNDPSVYVWFLVSGALPGDVARADWTDPTQTHYFTSNWSAISWQGTGCFWARINISGEAAASRTGTWSVRVVYNSHELFTRTFIIADPATRSSITVTSRMMTANQRANSGCTTPVPITRFLTADPDAVLWFSASGAKSGDSTTVEFLDPGNNLYQRSNIGPIAWEGSGCFWSTLNIARTEAAKMPGAWRARVYYNADEIFTESFTIASSSEDPLNVRAGYAILTPASGSSVPAASVVFSSTQGGVLVSEAEVPAVGTTTSIRIFADLNPPHVNTGLAIANANNRSGILNLTLTTLDGSQTVASKTEAISAYNQVAKYVTDWFPGVSTPFQGVLNVVSDVPIAAVTLRQSINSRGEALLTTLPVVDLTAALRKEAVDLPHMGDGDGILTQFVLINPTSSIITGAIGFFAQDGNPLPVTIGNSTGPVFSYSIPAGGVWIMETSGTGSIKVGSLVIDPTDGHATPVATAVFRLRKDGVLISEAGVGSSTITTRARVSVHLNDYRNVGIAVDNPWAGLDLALTFTLRNSAGEVQGNPVTQSLPPAGQLARFVTDLFPSLQLPFEGVLDVSGSLGFAGMTLRQATNERGEPLLTTLPVVDFTTSASGLPRIAPHLGVGTGFETEMILLNSSSSTQAGVGEWFAQDGNLLRLLLASGVDSSTLYSLPVNSGMRFKLMSPLNMGAVEASGFIGAAGGSVEMTNPLSAIYRAKIEIPAGALSETRQITISSVELPAKYRPGVSAGPSVDFGPNGLEFKKPVKITLPYSDKNDDGAVDGSALNQNFIQPFFFDARLAESTLLAGAILDNRSKTISFEVNHLTPFDPGITLTRGQTITYCISPPCFNLSAPGAPLAVRNAFQNWALALSSQSVSFQEIPAPCPNRGVDVMVKFARRRERPESPGYNNAEGALGFAIGIDAEGKSYHLVTILDGGDLETDILKLQQACSPFDPDPEKQKFKKDVESIATHEIGHVLGLPDRYGNPDAQGNRPCLAATGNSVMCALSPCSTVGRLIEPGDRQELLEKMYQEAAGACSPSARCVRLAPQKAVPPPHSNKLYESAAWALRQCGRQGPIQPGCVSLPVPEPRLPQSRSESTQRDWWRDFTLGPFWSPRRERARLLCRFQ